MEEKRKDRRLDLDVSIELERLDQGEMTTLKMMHVVVTDLSSSGMGFQTWISVRSMTPESGYGRRRSLIP